MTLPLPLSVDLCTYTDIAYVVALIGFVICILIATFRVRVVLHSSGSSIVRTRTGYKGKTLGFVASFFNLLSFLFAVIAIAGIGVIVYCN